MLGTGCWVSPVTAFSIFVVAGIYCHGGLLENKTSEHPQQSPPPRGNRNRPIGPSTVPGRACDRHGHKLAGESPATALKGGNV